MSAAELSIVKPANGASFEGVTVVQLEGDVHTPLPEELVGVALYYRWYSSLFPAEENRYSINESALTDPTVPYDAALSVGTHVITFATSDRPGETQADQNATQHGGVTGGEDGEGACIIHIFRANIISPANGAELSKASSILEAEAPIQWGKKNEVTNLFEPNSDYHRLNQIRYHWQFRPRGLTSGRPSAELIPALEALTFVPEGADAPLVRYEGALPDTLATGNYTLILRVESLEDSSIGHEVSRNIMIVI